MFLKYDKKNNLHFTDLRHSIVAINGNKIAWSKTDYFEEATPMTVWEAYKDIDQTISMSVAKAN